MEQRLSQSTWATIKECHRLDNLNIRNLRGYRIDIPIPNREIRKKGQQVPNKSKTWQGKFCQSIRLKNNPLWSNAQLQMPTGVATSSVWLGTHKGQTCLFSSTSPCCSLLRPCHTSLSPLVSAVSVSADTIPSLLLASIEMTGKFMNHTISLWSDSPVTPLMLSSKHACFPLTFFLW